MTESQAVQVFVADEFKRVAQNLRKRYRNIESDLQTLIERLQNGDLPGDRISGFADYVVYKVRVKNSDIRKGKSGGYRIIYQSLTQTAIDYSRYLVNL